MPRKTPEMDIASMMKQRGIGGVGPLARRPGMENGASAPKTPQIIRTTVNFKSTPAKKG